MKRALLGLILLVSACGHSEPTRFYTLAPKAPSSRAAYNGPPVRLEAVHLPPSVAGHRLLHAKGDNQVSISTLERWTDDLDFLMRQTLAQNLVARLPEGSVIFPDAPRPVGALLWTVDVLTLREADGKLTFDASWSLLATNAPQVLERRQGSYSAPVDGTGDATAQALAKISAELADAMVASLPQAAANLATQSPSASAVPVR